MAVGRPDRTGLDLGFCVGAGEGNRTLMTSLEGWGSAIELRPRARRGMAPHRIRTDSVPARGPAGCVVERSSRRRWLPCRCLVVPATQRPVASTVSYGSVPPGCSAAWLARLLWEQEAAGSNPAIPTKKYQFRAFRSFESVTGEPSGSHPIRYGRS